MLPEIEFAASAEGASVGCDALLVLTEWPEFKQADLAQVRDNMVRPLVVDGRNLLDPEHMRSLGFEYISIGRP